MAADAIAGLPAYPPAIAEWEDLLVRLEIMPRALRAALEEDGGGDAAAPLAMLLDREQRVGRWLEEAAFGSAESPAAGFDPGSDARWLAERFTAVRARNFAMVQRRGVDVWEWSGELDGVRVTVYQLLSWLMRSDAALLAALRGPRLAADGVHAC